MDVNELTFAAIGPYPEQVHIDFDALGGHALFAIDGPTGSGKSTVIDAIVFALYGDVAGGAESDRVRLRSAYAAPSQETFVELVFTTAADRYRVRRQPEYLRPKARGTGQTAQKATSQLWHEIAPGQWESMATSNAEVGAEVTRIVGLDKSQFLQTVVLPQGKFATFLRADSSERQKLLERIFATGVYARVQDVLQDMRRAAEAGVDAARHAVEGAEHALRGRLRGTAYDLDALDDERDVADDDRDAIDRDRDREGNGGGDASATDDGTLFALDIASQPEPVEPFAALVARIDTDAIAARKTADEQSALLATARETAKRLNAADSARLAVDEARTALAKRQAAVADARADLADHALVLGSLEPPITRPAEVEDVADVASRLSVLRGRLDEVSGLAVATAANEREVAGLARDRATTATQHAAIAEQVRVTIPAAILAAAQRLVADSDAARATAQSAAARHSGLVQARIDGMAGELAHRLAPGSACPVCGSVEHPAPAVHTGEPVAPEDIDAAQRAAVKAQQASERAGAERSRADAEVERLRTNGVDLDALAPASSSKAITTLVDDLESARESEQTLATRMATIDTEIARLTAVIDADRAKLAARAAPFGSVAERMAAVDAASKAVACVTSAMQQVEQQRAVLDAATTAADEAAKAVAGIDVDAERERLATVEADARAADRRVHDLDGLRAAVAGIVRDIDVARADLAVVEADALPVRRMADAVAGRAPNTMKQELRAYVLQQMFDEVLLAANARLRGMLDGNFMLIEDEASRGNKKAGLGLAVRDMRTDSVRSAESLSGGETFCASLSLALGLADTVRAHAGGVEIGMLIVDEGFGSLDPERLDDVINELNALRVQGRNVGVISHVEDMKKAINDAIHVRPRADGRGSDLTVTWMA